MRRIQFAFVALVLAVALYGGARLSAQLPGCPVGIPQTFQSSSYCYFFGSTWFPSGTTGGVVDIATTIRPSAGGGQAMDGLLVNPTLTFASSGATTVTTFAGIHAGAITNSPTSGVSVATNFLVDAAPTGTATSNFGAYLKGTVAFSATPRVAFAPQATPAILAGTFGTSATIIANSPAAMVVDTGTASPTSGVITFPSGLVQTGWICNVMPNVNGIYPRVTAVASDSITISNYGFASSSVLAWANNTKLYVTCVGY